MTEDAPQLAENDDMAVLHSPETKAVYAAIQQIHASGVDCGDLVGSWVHARLLSEAALEVSSLSTPPE